MQPDRSADPARLAGSVRGLGVCDALRVELTAGQLPALRAALTDRRAALERELIALGPPTGSPRATSHDAEAEHAHRCAREELRLLTQLAASTPVGRDEPAVLTGPAGLVLELMTAALRATVGELAADLGEDDRPARASTLESVGAWIATALDCQAVEGFCLEPGIDPAYAW